MKKRLTIFMLAAAILTAVALSGCADKAQYSAGGFTCDSLSTVTGNKEKIVSMGNGIKNGDRYIYRLYSFKTAEERDSAEEKYIEYIQGIGFSELDFQAFVYDCNGQSVSINYRQTPDPDGKNVYIGIETNGERMMIAVLVN